MSGDLTHALDEHSRRYSPWYKPYDNSDHYPMLCLAYLGLGVDSESILRRTTGYCSQLDPLADEIERIGQRDWEKNLGHKERYPDYLRFFRTWIEQEGYERVLHAALPLLISGFIRDAFHPLIRLGYGIEFLVDTEIAAGLAYLAAMAPDARLVSLASAQKHSDQSFCSLLRASQPLNKAEFTEGSFNHRYSQLLSSGLLTGFNLQPLEVLARVSFGALAVFASTSDFFALHLVTVAHAYRMCLPYIGKLANAFLPLGVLAGYHCIGAPEFEDLRLSRAGEFDLLPLLRRENEHDVKLAYSCTNHARAFSNSCYLDVAAKYLVRN